MDAVAAADHILKALDDVAVVGLEGQRDNLAAADLMQRIRSGELVVVPAVDAGHLPEPDHEDAP
jgi:hypothetical protein